METGNDLIDSEHRMLFDAINELLDACASGSGRAKIVETAQFLADYVDQHFSDEEQLQRDNDYPHYKSHHTFHIKYKGMIRDLSNDLKRSEVTIQKVGELNRLVSILISHIKSEDKRLANYIKSREA
ncbi:MAG: hemerythrin family protein [Butyricicoccus sp.]|nr:hemerythrin family protein [Butyricicoccus sp.]